MNPAGPRVWSPAPYHEADVPGMLGLIRSYYGDIDTTSEEFFRWQYEANPSGKVILWIARHDDTGAVMGQHVLLPMRASVDGRDVKSVLSFNALVAPQYHKQGIWSGLGDACNDAARDAGVAFSYGIPNPNSRIPMTRRLGYHDLGNIDLMAFILRAGPVAGARFRGIARGAAGMVLGAARPFLFRRRAATGGFDVRERDGFDGEFDRLYAAFRRRYRVMIRRDAAHLNWRYTGVPGRRYRIFAAYQAGELTGYAVFRATTFRDVPSGILLDLAGAGEAAGEAQLAAVNAGIDALVQSGTAACFAYMVPGTEGHRVLVRAGFRVPPGPLLPQPFPLLVKPWAQGPDVDPALLLSNWYFTVGDYDVF